VEPQERMCFLNETKHSSPTFLIGEKV